MKHMSAVLLFTIFVGSPGLNRAQDRSWQQYNGNLFSFSYPGTWRVSAPVDRDVTVADLANPINLEFAISAGQPGSAEKLALNAEKHVLQFAQMNNLIARFESVQQLDNGTVKVISHVCSLASEDTHFCPPNDPKKIDVSSIIAAVNGRILLIEMMHRPELGEAQVKVGRQIVETLKLRN